MHTTHSPESLFAHLDWARSLAGRLVGDAAAADDLVQEACVLALERPPASHWAPRKWLGGVLRNLARDRGRSTVHRSDREAESARPERIEGTHDVLERAEAHRSLVEAILALDERPREVVLLRYFDGLSQVQIAKQFGTSPSTIRSRLQRALDQLRDQLDGAHGADGRSWAVAMVPLVDALPARKAGAGLAAILLGLLGIGTAVVYAASTGNSPFGGRAMDRMSVAGPDDGSGALDPSEPSGLEGSGEGPDSVESEPQRTPHLGAPGAPSGHLATHRMQILHRDGTPAAGAELRYGFEGDFDPWELLDRLDANDLSSRFPHVAYADSEGAAELDLGTGDLSVLVTAPDEFGIHSVRAEDLEAPSEFTLQEDAPLTVKVVDTGGTPIEGVLVMAGIERSTSDVGGAARIEHALGMLHFTDTLNVGFAIPFPPSLDPAIDLTLDTWPDGGTLTLQRPAVGQVHVRCDPAAPWEGARLHAAPSPPPDRPMVWAPMPKIVGGEAWVTIGAGFSDLSIQLGTRDARTQGTQCKAPGDGEVVEVRFGSTHAPRLLGRVLDLEGQPLADTQIQPSIRHLNSSHSTPVKTNEAGRFRIPVPKAVLGKIEECTFTIEIETADAVARLSCPMVATGLGDIDLGDLQLTDNTLAKGRIVDHEGRLVQGARASASLMSTQHGRRSADEYLSSSLEDGSFLFGGTLEAGQELDIQASAQGYSSKTVTVEPGRDIEIVLEKAGAFTFELSLPDGISPSYVNYRVEGEGAPSSFQRTGSEPATHVTGLAPGLYSLVLELSHGDQEVARIEGIRVAAGQTNRDPRINPWRIDGHLRVHHIRVLTPERTPARGIEGWVLDPEQTGARGIFPTEDGVVPVVSIPAHPRTVSLMAPGHPAVLIEDIVSDREVVLAPGIPVELDFHGALPDPEDEFEFKAILRMDHDRFILKRTVEVVVPPSGKVSLDFPEAGEYRLEWSPSDTRGPRAIVRGQDPRPLIAIPEGGTVLQIEIPEEALESARREDQRFGRHRRRER